MAELGGHGAGAPQHPPLGEQAGAHASGDVHIGKIGLLHRGEHPLGIGKTGGVVQKAEGIARKGLPQLRHHKIIKIHPDDGGKKALTLFVHDAGNDDAHAHHPGIARRGQKLAGEDALDLFYAFRRGAQRRFGAEQDAAVGGDEGGVQTRPPPADDCHHIAVAVHLQGVGPAALMGADAGAAVHHISAADQFIHQAGNSGLAQIGDAGKGRAGDVGVAVDQAVDPSQVLAADDLLGDQCHPCFLQKVEDVFILFSDLTNSCLNFSICKKRAQGPAPNFGAFDTGGGPLL